MSEVTDRWITPGPQPNGIQAAADGVWVIDQSDNHLYKLAYEDGSVLARLPTETDRSSGVTEGGGYVWVASTYTARIYKLNYDGTTVEHYDTPGAGVVDSGDPARTDVTGAHGMEWLDGSNMWMAVPPARRLFLVDPGTMEVRRSIPTPGAQPSRHLRGERVIYGARTPGCARYISWTRKPARSGPRSTCRTRRSTV